jgi:hypothetical protein
MKLAPRVSVLFAGALLLGASLACPSSGPPPNTPGPDAQPGPQGPSDAPSPVVYFDGPLEGALCAELAAKGCALGASSSCPSTLAKNRIGPGQYATRWAACLFQLVPGADVSSCQVPCQ